jgi:hypothetical protein
MEEQLGVREAIRMGCARAGETHAPGSSGSGFGLAIAEFLKLEHPIYAFIAAVIVTDLSPSRTRGLGLQRLAATVVGAMCGATLHHVPEPSAWAFDFGILVAMLICHVSWLPVTPVASSCRHMKRIHGHMRSIALSGPR